ncbi:MAG TPA: rhomboid family intramembrane serine protease [Baekduia sp.]|nr:rhomboid family intramembrane serine protease [Baekduia sp.]
MFPIKDNIAADRFPFVTLALIAANVVMYFVFQKGGLLDFRGGGLNQSELVHYGAIPFELTNPGDHCDMVAAGQVACEGQRGVTGVADDQIPTGLTVLTSMFTHGGILHLAGNLLFLWIFGNNVEDSMGRVRFVLFYLLGGVAALGLQVAIEPGSMVPTLGASGAIAGVLGGYILIYPRARVLTVILIVFFFTIIEIPALLVLGLWIVQQAVFGALDITNPTGGSGGVAYFAHIGGFVFGLLAIKLFATRRSDDYRRLVAS